MFLSETWLDWEQMIGIKERLDFGDLCIVPSEGRVVDWLCFGKQTLKFGWIVFLSTILILS